MEQEQHYIKGFNSGYLIAKHEPALAAKLNFKEGDSNPFIEGLTNGRHQYEQEVKEWAKTFRRSTPTKDDKSLGIER